MTAVNTLPEDAKWEEDPVYRNSRREACLILGLWATCFAYTLTFCYLFGYTSHEPDPSATGPSIAATVGPLEDYNREPESVTYPFGLGIPDWVFWGVGVPWLVCVVLSFFYGLVLFAEDDLGGESQVTEGKEPS